MKAGDILELLQSSDRIRIMNGETELYCGYKGMINFAEGINEEELMKEELKEYRVSVEIRHRKWKELGLMAPLQPGETEQYRFADLQMSLYHIIEV
jgi:hypothetical protein